VLVVRVFTKNNLLLLDVYISKLNFRTAKITSCMYDINDIIFHIVNAMFYTKNSTEVVRNFITHMH